MSKLARFKAELEQRVLRIARDRRAVKKLRGLIKREKAKTMRLSDAGAKFITSFEGYSPVPTDKVDGFSTVGFGHLIAHRPVNSADLRAKWVPGQRRGGYLYEPEALELFKRDVSKTYVPAVAALFKDGTLDFDQHLFDALVSAAFNLGIGAVRPGTAGFETLGRAISAGSPKAIAAALPLYVNGPNGPLPGLVRRRRAEARLIRTGSYSTE